MASIFKNNLRFALKKESMEIRENLPKHSLEKIGDLCSWFLYESRNCYLKYIKEPKFITVILTIWVMFLVGLLFYPSIAWGLFVDSLSAIIEGINWQYVRFVLWLASEISILGLGFRSLGRFLNKDLMAYYKIN